MFKHYLMKFFIRIGIFLGMLYVYIAHKELLDFTTQWTGGELISPIHILWLVMVVEMLMQINPKGRVSRGCLKQFANYYVPPTNDYDKGQLLEFTKKRNLGAIKVLLAWICGNLIIGAIYYFGFIGVEELVLLSFLYYIGDLICVVFFCPFQVIFMRNRCCVNCRIFAWAHFMMATPLLFVQSFYSWSLFVLGIIILIKWEYTYIKYPERFYEGSNEALKCINCTDQLCKIRKPVNENKSFLDIIKRK